MGGGSGGHVTPVVAVLKEIRAQHPRAELRFWCDFKFAPQARSSFDTFDSELPIHRIVAGKFRRYHHLTTLQHILWPSLMLKNLRDAFLVGIGFVQSFFKLIIWRPDVVFAKGGYVCLPVGLAAHILRIPLVIHDSDALPGLTNRVLSRWADSIATGAPLEYYSYPAAISKYVGTPISEKFHPYGPAERKEAKAEQGIAEDRPLILVTGGGLGATNINNMVAETLHSLQRLGSVILIAGAGQYDELRSLLPPNNEHFQLHPFVTNMDRLVGMADVAVTRAGATSILELAAAAVPTILIPNGALTGGHQLKNAAVYEEAGAVLVLSEEKAMDNPHLLVEEVKLLIDDPAAAKAMAKRLHGFAKPDAAKDMAAMILEARR